MTASINIYFKEAYFTRLKRYEIYGFSDFLSSTGGIFGLFLGCSVISFIEIIYHLLTYCVRKMKKHAGDIINNNSETTRI
jgi:acid-sensing ion channel, other